MCMGAIPPPLPWTVRDWCSGAMARQESLCHGQHRNSTMSVSYTHLDSVNELESTLDQSKESMYKLSYVVRVTAPDLE